MLVRKEANPGLYEELHNYLDFGQYTKAFSKISFTKRPSIKQQNDNAINLIHLKNQQSLDANLLNKNLNNRYKYQDCGTIYQNKKYFNSFTGNKTNSLRLLKNRRTLISRQRQFNFQANLKNRIKRANLIYQNETFNGRKFNSNNSFDSNTNNDLESSNLLTPNNVNVPKIPENKINSFIINKEIMNFRNRNRRRRNEVEKQAELTSLILNLVSKKYMNKLKCNSNENKTIISIDQNCVTKVALNSLKNFSHLKQESIELKRDDKLDITKENYSNKLFQTKDLGQFFRSKFNKSRQQKQNKYYKTFYNNLNNKNNNNNSRRSRKIQEQAKEKSSSKGNKSINLPKNIISNIIFGCDDKLKANSVFNKTTNSFFKMYRNLLNKMSQRISNDKF